MRRSVYRAGAVISAVGSGVLLLAGVPAGALAATAAAAAPGRADAPGRAAAATAGGPVWASQTRWVNHFNEDAAHSPQLLSQIAGASGTSASGTGASGTGASGTGASGTNTATPAATSVISGALQGIDVASYQEKPGIDWKTVAATKQFAAIKVTEGTYYANQYAASDLTAAKAAGLAVISYAFAIPNGDGGSASPTAQADYAVAHAAGLHGDVPPIMLDIEYDPYYGQDGTNICYGLTRKEMASWIQAFGAEVKSKTGRGPIVYTTRQWWKDCVGTDNAGVAGDALWVARYDSKTPPSPGTLPPPWPTGSWTYWQYGQSSQVNGINGTVDLDQLNPALFTVLAPGDQQVTAGQAVTKVTLHSSQAGTTYSQGASWPSWLTLTGGTISGTAPSASTSYGPHKVTLTAASSGGATVSATFTWYVHGTLTVPTPASQTTVAGSPVGVRASATGSPSEPPLVFSALGLPPGVSMTSGGLMTGWPQTPGSYHVTVRVHDAWRAYGVSPATFTWTVTSAPDTGPTGKVRLDLDHKCLTDFRNRSRNGNPAEIWRCHSSTAQRWTYAQDGTLRIHGKCLTAPATVSARVRLRPCDGSPSSQWMLAYPRAVNPAAGAKPLTLVNPWTGWCLADPGASRTNGTKVVAAPCDGHRDQAWQVPAGQIASQVPGKCAKDNRNRKSDGTPVVLSRCRNISAERWTVKANGTVRVHGRCLTVARGRTAPGTRVWLWRCASRLTSNRGKSQQWRLIPTGAGSALVNPTSGLCVTDPGNAVSSGTRLRMKPCAGEPGQVWRLR